MRIPFVGPSATTRSTSADVQRSVNCYVEMDNASPRAPVAMYGTPGLVLRATLGTLPSRGCIASAGVWYWVAGNTVYSITTSYVVTTLGVIGTSTGRVGMATDGPEVLIVDGVSGWIVSGGVLTEIADVDFPDGVTVATCQDGYFLVSGDGTQRVYWNASPNTGTAWDGLDFASAEGSPDVELGVVSDHRQVWVSGTLAMEVWENTGSDPLFARSGNAFIEQGAASTWTVQPFDNSIVWLSSAKEGQGLVLKSQGGSPLRISTHALEEAISGYSTISDAFAFTYQIKGHSFYVLSFPTADATWFYDAASQQWFEWLWRDPATNQLHRHRAACCAFNGGVHLVGDWETGEVYSLEMETYTDNLDPIKRLRRTQTLSQEGKPLFFSNLIVDMETGVGLADGQGSDPQIMLRYSDDDGHTWSNEKTRSIGAAGEYATVVKFGGSLGRTKRGKGRVWELSMTDPVKFSLFSASVDVIAGT